MTPAEILDGAIDVIHERGWCQGALDMPDGRVCLMGACYQVTDNALTSCNIDSAFLAIIDVLHERYGLSGGWSSVHPVAFYNDAHLSDADEAIEVLKLARERVS
jgi:hypothetical protein